MMYAREDWFCVLAGLVVFLAALLVVNAWACLSHFSQEKKEKARELEAGQQSPRVRGKVFPDENDIDLVLEIVNRRESA